MKSLLKKIVRKFAEDKFGVEIWAVAPKGCILIEKAVLYNAAYHDKYFERLMQTLKRYGWKRAFAKALMEISRREHDKFLNRLVELGDKAACWLEINDCISLRWDFIWLSQQSKAWRLEHNGLLNQPQLKWEMGGRFRLSHLNAGLQMPTELLKMIKSNLLDALLGKDVI